MVGFNKQIVVFGAGRTFEHYLERYGEDFPPSYLVDNDEKKWGTKKLGYEIKSPDSLLSIPADRLCLVICSIYFNEIEAQLHQMNIQDYFIYSLKAAHTLEKLNQNSGNECMRKKRYNTGYIAGVFDLFHIGHLNLLRRAKEKCGYLIVGVLADELVMHFKNKLPIIPEEERKAIIQSVKYVDNVVTVTMENIDKMAAWELYHFDCLFSGDDWKDEPSWLEDKKKLNQVGSNIEFFPYTKSTSSTQIRSVIQKLNG